MAFPKWTHEITSMKRTKTLRHYTFHSGSILPIETADTVMAPTCIQESLLEHAPFPATPGTQDGQIVKGPTTRSVRGPTRGINTGRLIEAQGGAKLIVMVPLDVGAPVGVNATKFSNWLGLQIRIAAPLKNMYTWDNINTTLKALIIQATRDKFEILEYDEKEHVSPGINTKCQKLYRSWQHRMKEHYEELVEVGHDPYNKTYKGVNSEDWAWMIDNVWKDADKEAIKNDGQRPHFVDFYKTSHYSDKKKKWIDPKCQELHEHLEARRQEVEGDESTVYISQEELSVEILGQRSRYLRGYGVGTKPSYTHRASA